MAKRKRIRRKGNLGDSAPAHARKMSVAVELMENFAEQAERMMGAGECKQATDALLAATKSHGAAIEHRTSASASPELNRRLTEAALRISRLRRSVLDNCTRS